MILKPIITSKKVILVSGKVFYNDRRRRIDIKRPIRDLFEDSSFKIRYIMEMCFSEEKAVVGALVTGFAALELDPEINLLIFLQIEKGLDHLRRL